MKKLTLILFALILFGCTTYRTPTKAIDKAQYEAGQTVFIFPEPFSAYGEIVSLDAIQMDNGKWFMFYWIEFNSADVMPYLIELNGGDVVTLLYEETITLAVLEKQIYTKID